MAHPLVSRHGIDVPLSLGDDGYKISQPYTVLGVSQIDAINVLESEEGISRGSVYRDAYGQIVRSSLTLRSYGVKVHTPASLGGDGLWTITANYAETDSSSSDGPQPDPVAGSSPVYQWRSMAKSVKAEWDVNSRIIRSSSDEIPQSLPSRDLLVLQISVTWYASTFSTGMLVEFSHSVNSRDWQGIPAGQAKIGGLSREQQEVNSESGEELFKMTASIEAQPAIVFLSTHSKVIDPDGGTVTKSDSKFSPYRFYMADQAYGKFNNADPPAWEEFTDASGRRRKQPTPLDGAGGELQQYGTPVFIEYQMYEEKDFRQLGI